MQYIYKHFGMVLNLLGQHLVMTVEVLAIALVIALPVGYAIAKDRRFENPVLTFFSVIYTIPSLSLFVLLIPVFGLGRLPAVVALVAYSQIMLVRNWVVGLTSIDPKILEAADGLGMNGWKRFIQVEFPLATPYLLSGLRLAAISTIGIGTIAAYINAGGLGTLLFEGVINNNNQMIYAGSLSVAVLAIAINYLLRFFEKRSELRIKGESH